jgi:hypothetical protein
VVVPEPPHAGGADPAEAGQGARTTTAEHVPGDGPKANSRQGGADHQPSRLQTQLDRFIHACIHACMATKTISVDLAAYEMLRKARLRPDESFSQVIKRARWDESPSTGATLLRVLETAPIPSQRVLARLEKAQAWDEAPEDAWKE